MALRWTIDGAEGLPIHGDTDVPAGGARAVALVVHGWTGTKDRNFGPILGRDLASAGVIAHRFTLSHAGVEKDADIITRLDEFERDSLAFCVHDIHAVVDAMATGTIPGAGLPMVLIGHSRAGSTVIRAAALAAREGWPIKPAGVVTLSSVPDYPIENPEGVAIIERDGSFEREVGRAEGGKVRMGPSWIEHTKQGVSLAEDAASIRCPALVIHGTEDDAVPFAASSTVMALLAADPAAEPELVAVEGADHVFSVNGIGLDREGTDHPHARQASDAVIGFIDRRVAPA